MNRILAYIKMLNLQLFFAIFFSFAKKKILGINFCLRLVIFDSCHYYLAELCVLPK